MGYVLPLEAMEGFICAWYEWMQAFGSFYNYHDTDCLGRVYEVHMADFILRCGCRRSVPSTTTTTRTA